MLPTTDADPALADCEPHLQPCSMVTSTIRVVFAYTRRTRVPQAFWLCSRSDAISVRRRAARSCCCVTRIPLWTQAHKVLILLRPQVQRREPALAAVPDRQGQRQLLLEEPGQTHPPQPRGQALRHGEPQERCGGWRRCCHHSRHRLQPGPVTRRATSYQCCCCCCRCCCGCGCDGRCICLIDNPYWILCICCEFSLCMMRTGAAARVLHL